MPITKKPFIYLLPGLITAVFVLLSYALKGIFPFGAYSVAYADMGQMYVPVYYHVWDFLRGNSTWWFSWLSGGGINMSAPLSNFGGFSLLNLLLYLSPRHMILEFMSFLLLAKIMLSAWCMFIFLRKCFTIDPFWQVTLAVSYAFSGYMLFNYVNTNWLDNMALLPLLALAFWHIVAKGKFLSFSIAFALSLVANPYITVMKALYIAFVGGLFVIFFVKKSEQKAEVLLKLVVSVVLGTALAAAFILPGLLHNFASLRTDMFPFAYFDLIRGATHQALYQKIAMAFLSMGLPISAIVTSYKYIFRDKKTTLFLALVGLIIFLPIAFEGVNYIWHTGFFMGYAMRYGFTMPFTIIAIAAYGLGAEVPVQQALKAKTQLRKTNHKRQQLVQYKV